MGLDDQYQDDQNARGYEGQVFHSRGGNIKA
jgi:hypothetical protein